MEFKSELNLVCFVYAFVLTFQWHNCGSGSILKNDKIFCNSTAGFGCEFDVSQ